MLGLKELASRHELLADHTNDADHRESPVVELLRLVALPVGVGLPLGGAEEVARLIVRPPAVEDPNHLHEHDEGQEIPKTQQMLIVGLVRTHSYADRLISCQST